ncbi:MAG: hypothetical protein HYX94_13255 [Chloroflexi bacterium]|nr:hypothetical protein [Chloroflexota bacterium]
MGNSSAEEVRYWVMVDDNGRYMDEDARSQHGWFEDWETAVTACKGSWAIT